jgi:regulator of nucleoside diphosphate kinase
MQINSRTLNAPKIRIAQSDYERLSALANAVAERNPSACETLLKELDRASVMTDRRIPSDTVRMGSTVTYRTNSSEERTVTLVYPAEADIAEGKVSVLTPIGTALIGLSTGQSIEWKARDGRSQVLTAVAVGQPG